MKSYLLTIFLSLLFFVGGTIAQQMPQLPPVGTIELFGLQTVSEKQILSVLRIRLGDDAQKTYESAEENRRLLKSLPGVEDASVHLVCCNNTDGKSIVFVGIREKGMPPLTFRSAPNGKVRLTAEILQAGRDLQAAFARSVEEKNFSEDDSKGYALFGNKDARQILARFPALAVRNLKLLRRVLYESSDASQRALAAQIIAYAPDKRAIVGDLIFAVRDANDGVRNNATRALIILANYALVHPKLNIKIPAEDFISMLNSLDWTDRNKSLGVLDALTKKREQQLLAALKAQALTSLGEMARWKSHGQSAFSILGRIGGFSETEIEEMWRANNRPEQIQKMLLKIER